MKLRKCSNHASARYTLKSLCSECNGETKDAHYKFINLKNVPEKNHDEKSSRKPENISN